MNGTMTQEKLYKEMYIDSSELLIPRDLYQRSLNNDRVREIADNFDERAANEPKASARDGGFYVFDGQHTVAAKILLNGGEDLPILCKVYDSRLVVSSLMEKSRKSRLFTPIISASSFKARSISLSSWVSDRKSTRLNSSHQD